MFSPFLQKDRKDCFVNVYIAIIVEIMVFKDCENNWITDKNDTLVRICTVKQEINI